MTFSVEFGQLKSQKLAQTHCILHRN